MKYNAKKSWAQFHINNDMAYPSEYVIRIFKGTYPRLDLDKISFTDSSICDVGCGDGRNIVLLKECGFEDVYGVDISKEIIEKTKRNLHQMEIDADLRLGYNDNLPFESDFFDYILSWNSCYYMGKQTTFNKIVEEYGRICKKDGCLVASIPQHSCFIYQGSESLGSGYRIVKNDPFKVRNGEVLKIFMNKEDIEKAFSSHFYSFIHATITDDCFGFNYHWHIIICRRK